LKSGKSPGLDGLPAEFYRAFWPLLGTDFVELAQSAYESGTLSPSQRAGVSRLLYKKGDWSNLSNWRPISLLNTDYKILAKSLANRLKCVLGSVIHPDQTCTILRRSIHDNCATIRDVVYHCASTDETAAVISLDQEKAFDCVNWVYLSKVLSTFGFGESFQCWISTLYMQVGSYVIVNGWLTS
jgi:hypothetical protein